MTPAKRRPAAPRSEESTRAVPAPDLPTSPPDAAVPEEVVIASVPPAAVKDDTQLLGPHGDPLTQEAPPGDASRESAPPTETGQVDPEERSTKPSPGRSRALHPERVWPD